MFHWSVGVWVIKQHAIILSATVRPLIWTMAGLACLSNIVAAGDVTMETMVLSYWAISFTVFRYHHETDLELPSVYKACLYVGTALQRTSIY